jgi:TRAP-type C4-dicarboxylate transport system permease small subunit
MDLWDRAEQCVVGLLGLGALAIALWQVATRYLFPQGAISYAEEVMVYLVIWATMIVCSQLVRLDGHFATWTFLLAINALLLVLGCFLEVTATLLLVLPILTPALRPMGGRSDPFLDHLHA